MLVVLEMRRIIGEIGNVIEYQGHGIYLPHEVMRSIVSMYNVGRSVIGCGPQNDD